jgi:hypothetical protein
VTIRVHINTDFTMFGNVRIWVADFEGDRPRRIMRYTDQQHFPWEDIDDSAVGLEVEPTFTLQEDVARALLDSLVTHFQGAEDTRRLRADYDAALRRGDEKDKLIADVLRAVTSTR